MENQRPCSLPVMGKQAPVICTATHSQLTVICTYQEAGVHISCCEQGTCNDNDKQAAHPCHSMMHGQHLEWVNTIGTITGISA